MIAPLLATLLQVAYATSGTPVMASEQKITYDVAGTTVAELWQDIARHGPTDPATGEHYAGDLRWNVHWNYRTSYDATECHVASVDVTIETTMTIPRWTNAREGSEPLQVAWDVFFSRLKLHEAGHKDNAIKAAQAIRDAIAGVAAAPTCEPVHARIEEVARAVLEHWNQVDRDYDASTRHGLTQGAVLEAP